MPRKPTSKPSPLSREEALKYIDGHSSVEDLNWFVEDLRKRLEKAKRTGQTRVIIGTLDKDGRLDPKGARVEVFPPRRPRGRTSQATLRRWFPGVHRILDDFNS